MEKSLKEMLIAGGYKKEDMFTYYSDLYVYVTPISTEIITEWCKINGFNKDWHCPVFISQTDGKFKAGNVKIFRFEI